MTPRLLAVSGPLEGANVPIGEKSLSLGRNPSNDVCLPDRAVSRQHCLIEYLDGALYVRDLGSHNLTFVNNLPVDRHRLQHGDEIRAGQSVFLFLTEEDNRNLQLNLVDRNPYPPDESTTIVLRPQESVFLRADAGVQTHAEEGLRCLLEIAGIVSSERKLGAFAERLLEAIGDAIPAESAALLLMQPDGFEPFAQFRWSSGARTGPPPKVPQSIVNRVLSERVSIWSNNVPDETNFADSVVALQMRSILAVPLVIRGRAIGMIFVTAQDAVTFREHHLQLLAGIAGVAAASIETVLHVETLEAENRQLQAKISAESSLVGESAAIQAVRTFIAKVAPTASTVLITGESGTGKELVARAIHRNSPRSDKPFVAINCAAITETLLESELFGHERGAFTGAVSLKKGKLEEASSGSVFLDEVGEMPPGIQAKLLRVLQEREFERVGGTKTIRIDIRLIAATNRDLAEMARSGAFRQDLYYRLNVVATATPPLRERRQDIPLLARYFIQKHAGSAGRFVSGVSNPALACLTSYDWPGNVRELDNVIERAMVLGSSEQLMPDDLPECILETAAPAGRGPAGFHELVNEAKRRIVLQAVEQSGGNYVEAAELLGIHPNNLHRLIRNLQLKAAVKR